MTAAASAACAGRVHRRAAYAEVQRPDPQRGVDVEADPHRRAAPGRVAVPRRPDQRQLGRMVDHQDDPRAQLPRPRQLAQGSPVHGRVAHQQVAVTLSGPARSPLGARRSSRPKSPAPQQFGRPARGPGPTCWPPGSARRWLGGPGRPRWRRTARGRQRRTVGRGRPSRGRGAACRGFIRAPRSRPRPGAVTDRGDGRPVPARR